jgi:hypothetical protein
MVFDPPEPEKPYTVSMAWGESPDGDETTAGVVALGWSAVASAWIPQVARPGSGRPHTENGVPENGRWGNPTGAVSGGVEYWPAAWAPAGEARVAMPNSAAALVPTMAAMYLDIFWDLIVSMGRYKG